MLDGRTEVVRVEDEMDWRGSGKRRKIWNMGDGEGKRQESRTSADGVVLQVEPQEKKKTPKGRAKKRITYTRRFVNVTLTGGKRKVHLSTSPPSSSYLPMHLDEP